MYDFSDVRLLRIASRMPMPWYNINVQQRCRHHKPPLINLAHSQDLKEFFVEQMPAAIFCRRVFGLGAPEVSDLLKLESTSFRLLKFLPKQKWQKPPKTTVSESMRTGSYCWIFKTFAGVWQGEVWKSHQSLHLEGMDKIVAVFFLFKVLMYSMSNEQDVCQHKYVALKKMELVVYMQVAYVSKQ